MATMLLYEEYLRNPPKAVLEREKGKNPDDGKYREEGKKNAVAKIVDDDAAKHVTEH